jgi:WD40 repeat protein
MQIEVTKVRDFQGHRDAVFSLCLTPSGFISAGGDGFIVEWIWDSEDGTMLAKEEESIYSLEFHEENQFLLAGTRKGHILVLDYKAKNIIKRIEAHQGGIFGFVPMSTGYLSYGEDGWVKHWNKHFELVDQIRVAQRSVRCAVFINVEQIILGTSDHTIVVFNPMEFKKAFEWKAHENSVFGLAKGGSRIYSVGRDALLKSWNTEDWVEEWSVPAHMYTIHGLDFNPKNHLLISSSMDKTIKIWDTRKNKLLKVVDYERYESHTNCVNKVLWIDSNRFISCSDDRKICLFNVDISDHEA